MFKCNKISKPLIFGILCLAIFFVLFYFNIIQVNPRYMKEGMSPQTAVFFNEDDPNDKVATPIERTDEQSRVNREIKDYFNDNFVVNNDSYSGGFGANNFGWNNGVWLMQMETNKRLNYLQHSVDELRGLIDGFGKKVGVNANTKLH